MENVFDLAVSDGIELRRVSGKDGGEYAGPCPGCGGCDRFRVWPGQREGGSYWCRRCNKSGDTIQYLRDFKGLDFIMAAARAGKELSATACRTPRSPRMSTVTRPMQALNEAEIEQPPDLWQEKAGNFAAWAHDRLFNSEAAIQQLLRRGIKRETIDTWRLGFNDKDRSTPLKSWGLPLDIKRQSLWLPAGLVIPLYRCDKVLRIRIRRPQGKPKYFMVKGSCARLSMALRCNHQVVMVVESELDAILLDQELGEATGILALGSSSAKPDPETAIQVKKAALILLALDYDDAGKKASAWWRANYPQSKLWPVPAGKDPGEAFGEHGIDLKTWFTIGLPPELRKTITST